MSSWAASCAPVRPRAYACVTSENPVTRITHASAIGRAFSWTRRDRPVRLSAESTSELPAMKPATHAVACSARTSELRSRMCATSPGSTAPVIPGRESQVTSAGETEAITKTAASISEATASAPPSQARRTGHGSARQRSRATRVSRIPCARTSSLTLTLGPSAAPRGA